LLLGVALLAMGFSDIGYLFATARGAYVEGTPLDIGWPVSFALLGLAPWQRPRRVDALVFESWGIVVIPLLFALSSLCVLTGNRLWDAPSIAVVLAFSAITVGFIRLTLTFKEVRSLSESRREARTDELTSLGNRRLFYERITSMLDDRPETNRLSLLLIDLDRFKEINDSLGHLSGDTLLQEIARRLRDVIRASDTVARLGGDEFGLLLTSASGPGDVVTVIERVREAFEQPVVLQELPIAIEGSVGVALFPDDGKDVDTLIQHADVAMYTAKRENSVYAFYDRTSDDYEPSRLTLVSELRRALERHELVLYYQPKAIVATGEVRSVEALLRWNHPRRGLVLPDEFIPLAQQTGLIRPLTLYVIDEALAQCAAWKAEGLSLSIAVNLSMRNLLDVEFPEHVQRLLDRWEIDSGLLELEITESTMVADPLRTKVILDRLSAMGIRLSIDDFGTGYSSLAYLKRLPVNEIKIDRSFVLNMSKSEDDAAIVRSTIDLGRNLDLEVVAEGVETEEVWNQLSALGCSTAQGYFLSHPVPPEELRAWLRDRADGTVAAKRAA